MGWVAAVLVFVAGHSLADPLGEGAEAYESGEPARAISVWTPLAEAGNTRAQFYLSAAFSEKESPFRDERKALYWLRRAAEGGSERAQFKPR